MKDAFKALREHLYVFGKDELGVNYFYHNFERHLYLSEDRINAHVDETIVIEAIYRPMTEYIYQNIMSQMERLKISIWMENRSMYTNVLASIQPLPNVLILL